MAVELDHSFTTAKPIDESFAAITDLERVVPAVQGGSVLETTGSGRREGRDPGEDGRDVDEVHRHGRGHREGRGATIARCCTSSRAEAGGQGHANATVTFALNDGGGSIHTNAQITGKAASMGEGVVAGVLDALITDFTTRLGDI